MIILTFYNGLFYSISMTLYVASSAHLVNSPQDVAYNLIKEMDKNHPSRGSVRQVAAKYTPKIGGLYEVSVFHPMNAKVDALY